MRSAVSRRWLGVVGAAAALCRASAAGAEPYLDFRDVPYVYAQDLSRFGAWFDAAGSRTVRLAILGDSQETTPFGAGSVYIPRMNYEAWKRFGNVPETMVVGYGHYGGGIQGEWLLAGRTNLPGASPSRLAPEQRLPGIVPAAHSTTNSAVNVNGQAFGQLTALVPNGSGLDAAAGIPTDVDYFRTDGVVRARVFAATSAASGEVYYRARPTDGSWPSYAPAITTQGALQLGLESVTFAVKSALTAPLDFAGKRFMQLEVGGDRDERLTDILGVQFVNETHPEGMVFQRLATGGYTVRLFSSAHANAGPFFAAMQFDGAILHLGANDGADATPAPIFKSDVEGLIRKVREWTGDDQFKFVVAVEADQVLYDSLARAEYDRYAGAMYELARQDANVMVVNSRRIMHDQGWIAGKISFRQFVADSVHYTGEGAIRLARAEFAALASAAVPDAWRVIDNSQRLDAPTYLHGLTLVDQGRLDIAEHRLVIAALPGTGQAVLDQVNAWLKSGRVHSSSADGLTALGAILNDRGKGIAIYDQWDGAAVDADAVLLKYTWMGDANLDGVVNADDYFLIDDAFVSHRVETNRWYRGDFNLDGAINADDYFLIDSAYIGQSGQLASRSLALVPEPGGVGILLLGLLATWRRRCRR